MKMGSKITIPVQGTPEYEEALKKWLEDVKQTPRRSSMMSSEELDRYLKEMYKYDN